MESLDKIISIAEELERLIELASTDKESLDMSTRIALELCSWDVLKTKNSIKNIKEKFEEVELWA